MINQSGSKMNIVIGLDGMMMCCYKKIKNDKWRKMKETEKDEHIILRFFLNRVCQIEHAIYNNKKLYVWYMNGPQIKKRIDIEFEDGSSAAEVISKIKYVIRTIKRSSSG